MSRIKQQTIEESSFSAAYAPRFLHFAPDDGGGTEVAVADPPETPETDPPVASETPETPEAPEKAEGEAADETPALDKFEFGDDERKTTREINRQIRELNRVQKLVDDRKTELAKLRGEPSPKEVEPDEEGFVPFAEARLPAGVVSHLQKQEEAIARLSSELERLTAADTDVERQEHQEAIETGLRSLVGAAVNTLIPGLSERGAKRAGRDAWGEFEERLDGLLESGVNPTDITESQLQALVAESVKSVRDDLSEFGYKQLAANRKAAASQPPTLGGHAGVTAPKAYKDMTEDQKEVARAQAAKEAVGKFLKFGE